MVPHQVGRHAPEVPHHDHGRLRPHAEGPPAVGPGAPEQHRRGENEDDDGGSGEEGSQDRTGAALKKGGRPVQKRGSLCRAPLPLAGLDLERRSIGDGGPEGGGGGAGRVRGW